MKHMPVICKGNTVFMIRLALNPCGGHRFHSEDNLMSENNMRGIE